MVEENCHVFQKSKYSRHREATSRSKQQLLVAMCECVFRIMNVWQEKGANTKGFSGRIVVIGNRKAVVPAGIRNSLLKKIWTL